MSSKNLRGSVTNSLVHLSGFCANFPQMLFRQSLATVRRPAFVYDVVIAQIYSLVCTYALDESCFLLRSRASDGVSRRLHLNLHESVHVLCEKTSFASGLILHRRLIIVPRFEDFYDDVPDGHCFLQLDRDPRTRDIPRSLRV